jgi:hypothetical protein
VSIKNNEFARPPNIIVVSNIHENNFHAVFGLAIVLSVSSISHSTFASHPEIVPIADILEPLMHNRGIFKLLCFGWQWLHNGPLIALKGAGLLVGCRKELSKATQNQFSRLRNWMAKSCPDAAIRVCLFDTLEKLEITYAEVFSTRDVCPHPGTINIIWKWAAFTSQEYLSLLKGSNPLALIIFAHFAMLSGVVENEHWYLSGYARRALMSIRTTLPEPWREFLRWPEKQLNEGFCDLFGVTEDLACTEKIERCKEAVGIEQEGQLLVTNGVC